MNKVWAIALNSFHESLRKKTLYILLVVAFVVIGASKFFSWLSAEEEMKMIQDVSLSAIEFFGALIAIFGAIGTMATEIERKTVYTMLSKPITRTNFLVGKFLGLGLIMLLNYLLISAFFIALLIVKKTPPDVQIVKALILIFWELLLISSIALAVATMASEAFNLIFSFFLYIVGHLTSYGKQMIEQTGNVLVKVSSEILYTVIPNYENFAIRDKVVVGVDVSWRYVGSTMLYGLIYMGIAVLIAMYFFQKREI